MPELNHEEHQKLEELFKSYEGYLLRVAEKYVGQTDCAEDIVIEAFIKIIPHLRKLDLEDCHKARNYLVTVVEHLAIDVLRKKRFLPLNEELLCDFFTLEEELEKTEERQLIEQALKQLTLNDEQILRLKYLQNMSIREIAKILSIRESLVRKKLERARKHLKKIMEEFI